MKRVFCTDLIRYVGTAWVAVPATLLCCLLLSGRTSAANTARDRGWEPKKGPLATRWAREVMPERVHPEYPRPQMVRKEWRNLNGLWQYTILPRAAGPPDPREMMDKILVPFPIESALSGVMRRIDEAHRLWYRRTFDLPAHWKSQRVLLHFGAVDWETTVFVNGKEVGTHRGGYDGFTFDLTGALRASGSQELLVAVWDPTEGGQARGKQVRNPEGIWYTPTTGIWQTVWLEPVPASSLTQLRTVPDLDASCLRITAQGRGTESGDTIAVTALEGEKTVARASGATGAEITLPIDHPRLWSPETPYLYNLKVTLLRKGRPLDTVGSYFGMRKIAPGKDAKGVMRLLLNNKFVFQVGMLDQGFWPDGLYTAPTDEALRYDIETMKRLGFNMARKHVKVEPERWYYWCDRLGLLVWQDMPSTNDPDNRLPAMPAAAERRAQFEQELERLIAGRGNHPSVILWVVFNEGWGQYDTERLTALVKAKDPSRPVDNASGWTDRQCGDVIDMHNYPGPGSPKPESTRAAVLGEFGGLGLGVDGHTWAQKTWGYRQIESQEKLTRDYVRLLQKAWALKETAGLSAVVYTQTTDVETECNGLLTYDRAVLKVDAARVSQANLGRAPLLPEAKPLLATSEKESALWRYSLERPADGWFRPDFDEGGWKQGPGGFGTAGTPGAVVRTVWKTDDIWLRRTFTLSDTDFKDARLRVHHDEDVEIYLNGVLAARLPGFITEYEEADILPEARKALRHGENLLAVHCHQTRGGQYIDVGLVH